MTPGDLWGIKEGALEGPSDLSLQPPGLSHRTWPLDPILQGLQILKTLVPYPCKGRILGDPWPC